MADAGRVIAGSARGLRLAAPRGDTRPIGDRVKQTLFAILDPDLPGARVLDLFAGSGAAGIEALSRGAGQATFVERDADAARVIVANLARTRLADHATVVTADVLAWLKLSEPGSGRKGTNRCTPGEPATRGLYDIVIVDPPYADPALLAAALDAVGPWLAASARVVAKHFWREQPPVKVGLLASERGRRFGETALTFYRRQEDR